MKPAVFDYLAPEAVQEAVDALAEVGERVRILAGGQSLILEMRYRRCWPDLVVDINRVCGLDHLRGGRGRVAGRGAGPAPVPTTTRSSPGSRPSC
ncbi:FAD binding domain-containing protein, partial [Streptosporangium sp. NPDC001682]